MIRCIGYSQRRSSSTAKGMHLTPLVLSIGRFCAYNPTFTIVPTVAILFVLCFGSRYYTVTTDPVDLWVASNSRARLEKAYFDENFG